jgi:uncharacterized membrane protein
VRWTRADARAKEGAMIDPVLPLSLFAFAAAGLLLPWAAWRWLRGSYRRFSAMTPAEQEAARGRAQRRADRTTSGCLAVAAALVIAALAWVTVRGL